MHCWARSFQVLGVTSAVSTICCLQRLPYLADSNKSFYLPSQAEIEIPLYKKQHPQAGGCESSPAKFSGENVFCHDLFHLYSVRNICVRSKWLRKLYRREFGILQAKGLQHVHERKEAVRNKSHNESTGLKAFIQQDTSGNDILVSLGVGNFTEPHL